MDNKVISFLLIGIIVGAVAGVGVGYALFHQEQGADYWFYIDYGSAADETHKNGWVSVKATSTASAIQKVPGVKCSESTLFGLSLDEINGVKKESSTGGKYWAQYIRNGTYSGATAFEKNWSSSNFGLTKVYCNCMYLVYEAWGAPVTADTGWVDTGPFKSG